MNKNPFSDLTRFECRLYLTSLAVITASFLFSGGGAYLNMTASLIGVTALIFVAKGYVLGQVLTVVFSVFYGVISFHFRYYGEMITYLGMSAPIAAATAVVWMKHPFQSSREVEVRPLNGTTLSLLLLCAVLVTALFYFILKALGNASLLLSTLSVTTSFLAAALTFLRSPAYALGYAANDLVLIALWIIAARHDSSCLSMIACFAMFFFNDMYGFFNWQSMQKRQAAA